MTSIFGPNKRIFIIGLVITGIMLVPLVAMQFTDEVNWTLSDFIVAGVLLGTTGLLVELTMRSTRKTMYRACIVFALLAALLLIWAELAVGVFGTPWAGS